ncbi:LuxR C-terminal-related transcriptional regulator [Thauera terpenica]|uniref:LuxR C-terminal-related transcriptional regulator n=1 Tax=Thauera terpenica TaxID=76113 RepID=UPI000B496B90|nr:LuxR C-terminal-related transcriptional regulator [Thauera terpenica]
MRRTLRGRLPVKRRKSSISPKGAVRASGRDAPPNYAFAAVPIRLLAEVAGAADRPRLLALVAPVGYGKTVFMSGLYARLREQGEHCFWTSLDDRDGSVERVLRLLEEMAYRHSAQLHPTQALFRGDEPLESRVDGLVGAAAAHAGPFTVFIDNLDACADPALGYVLDRLVFETPPSVRFVISSTTDLPLDMTRARLEGLVRQIGFAELSLGVDEVAALLGAELAGAIGDEGVQAVARQTEGWPAAVRLAQIALAAAERPQQLLDGFSGSDQDLAAFLNRQVLSDFSAEMRDFLLGLGLLRTFCADLARQAIGCERAGEHLALLLQRNVFVIPLDRNRAWYRLHTLFREYLQGEARRTLDQARRAGILLRAAQWCDQQGRGHDAIDYALQAGAHEAAAEMLERSAPAIVRDRGDMLQYIEWADLLLQRRCALGWQAEYWYVWALVLNRNYERGRLQIDHLSNRIRLAGRNGGDADMPAHLQRRLDIIKASIDVFTDRLSDAYRNATLCIDSGGLEDPFDATAASCTASIYLSGAFRFIEAREILQQAQTSAYQTNSRYASGWVIALTALPPIYEGNYALIHPELEPALRALQQGLGEGAGICGTIALLAANCEVEMGRDEAALPLLLLGLRNAETHGFVDAVACGLDAAVKLWGGEGDGDGPVSLARLRRLAASYPPRLAYMLSCLLVRRLLRLGRLGEAVEEGARIGLERDVPDHGAALAVARVRDLRTAALIDLAIARGDGRAAAALIADAFRSARADGRVGRMVELVLAEMSLACQAGQTAAANRHLMRAVSLAASRTIVRPFLDHAPAIAALVEDTRPVDWGFALMQERRFFADLCGRLPIGKHPLKDRLAALQVDSPLADPLTRRQMELLLLLDAGLSNQQIADRSHVTVSTVKGHFQKLYAKLGVTSRAAALARARAMNLL